MQLTTFGQFVPRNFEPEEQTCPSPPPASARYTFGSSWCGPETYIPESLSRGRGKKELYWDKCARSARTFAISMLKLVKLGTFVS